MIQNAGFGTKGGLECGQDRAIIFNFSLCYSNCAACRYSGATKGSFIQQGRCWRRPAPGACAHQPGSCCGARPRPKTGRACAGLRGSGQPAQTAATAACAGLAPAHIQVPPASRLVHAHCPYVCSASASAGDPNAAVHTAPFQARTAPGNLLQGEIKNQT